MVRSLSMIAASAALAVAPIAAQAAPDRVAAPAAESEELGGGFLRGPGVIVGALVFALILYLTLTSERLDDPPKSP